MSFAAEPGEITKSGHLKGLVINQTSSYLAQTFYQAFCLAWHEQPNAGQFNITLKEFHSPRSGRQVQIIFDRQVAFAASLPNGNINVNDIAGQSAQAAIQRIQSMAVQDLALSNPDLARDEI